MSPFFSIVIPTYNHKNFLEVALKCVFSQSLSDWEVIIVDNHSNDGTEDLVTSFNCTKLKYLKVHNEGVIGTSRNIGMQAAVGEWVCFLDSDDVWHPQKLEFIYDVIQKRPAIDVIVHDELLVSDTNELKGKKLHYGPIFNQNYKYLLLNGNKLSTSATSIRRQFLINTSLTFSEKQKLVTVEDYDFWLKIAANGANFYFLHKILGYYLSHSSNNSKREKLHNQNQKNLLRYHTYEIQTFEPDKNKLWKNLMLIFDLKIALRSFEMKRPVHSLKSILGSFLTAPMFLTKFLANRIKDKALNKILFSYYSILSIFDNQFK
jgi:glycosyltransferase involved in cell wall biosynthesis